MDGDTLITLIGVTPGPDSLKELIHKVGLRVKVYKLIKTCYQEDSVSNIVACLKLLVNCNRKQTLLIQQIPHQR